MIEQLLLGEQDWRWPEKPGLMKKLRRPHCSSLFLLTQIHLKKNFEVHIYFFITNK